TVALEETGEARVREDTFVDVAEGRGRRVCIVGGVQEDRVLLDEVASRLAGRRTRRVGLARQERSVDRALSAEVLELLALGREESSGWMGQDEVERHQLGLDREGRPGSAVAIVLVAD